MASGTTARGSGGAGRIAAERERQILEEGFDELHDAGRAHELVDAASCYLRAGTQPAGTTPLGWPWAPLRWKPSADPVRNLEKAGALIAAAIDSLETLDALRAKL